MRLRFLARELMGQRGMQTPPTRNRTRDLVKPLVWWLVPRPVTSSRDTGPGSTSVHQMPFGTKKRMSQLQRAQASPIAGDLQQT